MKTFSFEIEGTTPLLHNRFDIEDYLHGGDKKPKTMEDLRKKALKAAYINSEGKPFAPSDHLRTALIEAGKKKTYKGKQTYAGFLRSMLQVEPLELLIEDAKFEPDFRRAVLNGSSTIIAARAMYPIGWKLSGTIKIGDDIDMFKLREILEIAGTWIGIGDYRPTNSGTFGQFKVNKLEAD